MLYARFKKQVFHFDFQTVDVSSTEDLHSVQRHDHQIPIIFQKLAPIDSQVNTLILSLQTGTEPLKQLFVWHAGCYYSWQCKESFCGISWCCNWQRSSLLFSTLIALWLVAGNSWHLWDPGSTGRDAPGTYLLSLSCHPWAPTWPWLCSFYTGLQFQ